YIQMVCEDRKRALILSTHQPAANPRALKEYETLKEQGFTVKYLYAYNYDWSHEIDEIKFAKGLLPRPDFVQVGGNPHQQPIRYFISRVLYRMFRFTAYLHSFFQQMGSSRSAWELWQTAAFFSADIYIAHYLGALPAAYRAAKKHNGVLLFDAEDFHRGERSYYSNQIRNVVEIENRLMVKAHAVTTASPMIAEEYKKLYPDQQIFTINNVFPRRHLQAVKSRKDNTLRLFWFSQKVGRNRGIEDVLQAIALCRKGIELHLLGFCTEDDKQFFHQLTTANGGNAQDLHFYPPVPEKEIFELAHRFDIGLATETGVPYNREICLTNKIFTYIQSGLAVIASDTLAQRQLLQQYNDVGFLYQKGSVNELARALENYLDHPALLQKHKRTSYAIGQEALNWEKEQAKFI
ncbi:MAG: glycosyltransferase, partial [Chitinophagaceae bacterium]